MGPVKTGSITNRAARACPLLLLLLPSLASGQLHSAAIGAYGGKQGTGIEVTTMFTRRIGAVGRVEGLLLSAEKAAWLGARADLISSNGMRVYALPLIGSHYCYLNEVGGTASGCDSDMKWKNAAALLAGLDLALGDSSRWSVGAEFGHRFVDAGERTRWARGVTIRYRAYQRRQSR